MSVIIEVSKDIAAPALTQYFDLSSARQIYDKQYYLEHKDARRAYAKQYYTKHKDTRLAYVKQYYIDNKEWATAYSAVHHVKYYADNKDEICSKTRQYYRDNKDMITEKKCAKFECACGGRYTATNKAQHEKSNKHIKSLEIA